MTKTDVRQALATCRFAAGPGREQEAAEAWAFELTHYFRRGIGEAPKVTYTDGVYTCTGLMQTTHPGDHGEHVSFDPDSPAWNLDYCRDPARRATLLTENALASWYDGR